MHHESTQQLPWAPLVAALLALATVVGAAAWGVDRGGSGGSLGASASAWASAPLPGPGTPIDSAMAARGADLFQAHCSACHMVRGTPKLGPNLAGVTQRRDPAWIRAMILRPDSMTRNDPVAAALKEQSGGVQMMVVGTVDPSDARAVLEFLRRVDLQGEAPDGG